MRTSTYRRIAAILCLGGCVFPLTSATAKPKTKPKPQGTAATAKAREAIQEACRSEDEGLAEKDVDKAFAYHDTNFEEATPEGDSVDLDEERQSFTEVQALIQSISSSTTVQKVVLGSGGATVTVKAHVDATLMNPATQQTARFVTDGVERQFWINGDDGWRLRKTRTLSGKSFLNGQRVKND